jgi:hypothetical protein
MVNSRGDPTNKVFQFLISIKNPTKELQDELSLLYYHILSTSNYFDGLQANPEKFIIDSQLLTGNPSMRKDAIYYYNLVTYITDSGIIFENTDTINSYSLGSISVDTNMRGSDNIIFYLRLTLNKIQTFYSRRYSKLQDTLAKIGGINKAINIVLGWIVLLFRHVYIENIIYPNFSKKKLNLNRVVATNHKNLKQNTYRLNETAKFSFTVSDKIKDGFWKKFFCKSKKLNDAEKKMKKTLNLFSIMKLSNDFDKMKKIILNKDQNFVFENLNLEDDYKVTKINDIEELFKAYENLKSSDDFVSNNMKTILNTFANSRKKSSEKFSPTPLDNNYLEY